MLITGAHGVRVDGRYPAGASRTGDPARSISIRHPAAGCGGCGRCRGTRGARARRRVERRRDRWSLDCRPRWIGQTRQRAAVIAADGRHSRVARSVGLGRYPQWPRRWAVGGYFSDVVGLTTSGEMHVRSRHYLGVAPLPGGLTNACVVTSDRRRLQIRQRCCWTRCGRIRSSAIVSAVLGRLTAGGAGTAGRRRDRRRAFPDCCWPEMPPDSSIR